MDCDIRKLAKSLSIFPHDMIFEESIASFGILECFEAQQAFE